MGEDKAATGPGMARARADRRGAPPYRRVGLGGQRDVVADERDRLADERERLADERELAADERERAADLREEAQDRRQREADDRQLDLDLRGRALGMIGPDLEQRMLDTIGRARELLELSRKRLDRQEARVRRERAGHDRQQAEVDRESAEGARKGSRSMTDPLAPIELAKALRVQALAAIDVFAASEEEAARILDQLAATVRPELRDEILGAASHARTAARNAREILRNLGDPEPAATLSLARAEAEYATSDSGGDDRRDADERIGQESRSAR